MENGLEPVRKYYGLDDGQAGPAESDPLLEAAPNV